MRPTTKIYVTAAMALLALVFATLAFAPATAAPCPCVGGKCTLPSTSTSAASPFSWFAPKTPSVVPPMPQIPEAKPQPSKAQIDQAGRTAAASESSGRRHRAAVAIKTVGKLLSRIAGKPLRLFTRRRHK